MSQEIISLQSASETFTKLFENIGNVAEKRGTKLTTIISGLSILVFLLLKHLIFKSNTIDVIDVWLLLAAVLIIMVGLLLGSFEYKLYNQSLIREKEILLNKYKLELDYNIKRLQLTQLPDDKLGNNVLAQPSTIEKPRG